MIDTEDSQNKEEIHLNYAEESLRLHEAWKGKTRRIMTNRLP